MWILIGWLLCVPAILLGPLAKLTPVNTNRPWVDGLLVNIWRAYKKYDAKSWVRRMIGIYHNPNITKQYLRILSNRQNVQFIGERELNVELINNFHDVQTDHDHHRYRVLALRAGGKLTSDYGPMVVVGNIVHDGNHRLAALKEVRKPKVKVDYWEEVSDDR